MKKCSEIGHASAEYQESDTFASREETDSLENLKSFNQKLPFDLISGYQANSEATSEFQKSSLSKWG